MKIIQIEILIDKGPFSKSKDWIRIKKQLYEAIKSVEWPIGSGSFILYDQPGKKRGEGSGVTPIKEACMNYLKKQTWDLETKVNFATAKKPGPIDATSKVGDRLFCVEWETGNISSSHRALNKMALGILKKILIGGILIVPTRKMYYYLTDRIGNFRELEPYFPFWKAIQVDEGFLAIIAIEHDAVSKDVPRIEKRTDGRALQ